MISSASLEVLDTLDKDEGTTVRPIHEERAAWHAAVQGRSLPDGVSEIGENHSGVACLRLVPDVQPHPQRRLIFIHGGGLVSGSIQTHRQLAAALALHTQSTVLMVGYRLLPEHPIGTPTADVLRVYRQQINSGMCQPQQCVLIGDSSGAALALHVMQQQQRFCGPQPAGFVSLSGALDATLSGRTMRTHSKRDPLLSLRALEHWQRMLGDADVLLSPELSPLFQDMARLPPGLLLVGSREIWLSDSLRLARALPQSTLRLYPGMWHVWPMWPELPESVQAFGESVSFVNGMCRG